MKDDQAARAPGLVRSAALLAIGNVSSRGLGMVRDMVIAYFLGASVGVASFVLANRLLRLLYDLLIGGMLSAALVPVFGEYTSSERESELWRLVSIVFTILSLIVTALVLLIELFAVPMARVLASGQSPAQQLVTAHFFRLMAPAALLLTASGVFTATLYALKRFQYPALITAVYNLGILIMVPLLADKLNAFSLAVGVLTGAFFQLSIAYNGVRHGHLRLDFSWHHPALRRIVFLYLPVAVSLLVGTGQGLFDAYLATFTGDSSLVYMANATTLVQLPLGLIAMAVANAALPSLAGLHAAGEKRAYGDTLSRSVRFVLYLTLPAAMLLFVLAPQLIGLIYQHGRYVAKDAWQTSWALRGYSLGLTFAALDWQLNYAFYAQQDTRTPTIVGIIAVGVYLFMALWLMKPLGMLGLVLADSSKHFSHALMMTYLTRRRLGHLPIWRASGKMAGITLLVGGAAWFSAGWLTGHVVVSRLVGDLLTLVLIGGGSALLYFLLTVWVRLPESRQVLRLARRGTAR